MTATQSLRRQIEMPDSWERPLDEASEGKRKFPREVCFEVCRELLVMLAPLCEFDRLRVCGSLRRRKRMVGDIELVFVPQMKTTKAAEMDLFGGEQTPAQTEPATAALLDDLVSRGFLAKRLKKDGTQTWGRWNRLAVHIASGVPIDFFGCLEVAWWNSVVCRTGGARTNTAIAAAAIVKGWRWEPSPEASGFRRSVGLNIVRHPITSERAVFDFVGIPYLEPWERD